MIKATIILGSDAIKYYKKAGEIPSGEWLMTYGGFVEQLQFPLKSECDAYIEGINSAIGWDDHEFILQSETPEDNTPVFRKGTLVKLTDEAIRIVRREWGDESADYRQAMILEVQHLRQDSDDGTWHIGVRDIHEDDTQEFSSFYLRCLEAKDIENYTGEIGLKYNNECERWLDKPLIRRLIEEQRLMKVGESDGFKLQLTNLWYIELKRENCKQFRYSINAQSLNTPDTFVRRYPTIEAAILHCLNGFNEDVDIPDHFKSIQDYLNSPDHI